MAKKTRTTVILILTVLLAYSSGLPVLSLGVPAADQWEDRWSQGNMTATNNTTDQSVTLSFTPGHTFKRMSTIPAMKLDGLHLFLTDINYSAIGLPIMIVPARGGWIDGAGLLYIASGVSEIRYQELTGGGLNPFKIFNHGSINYIPNSTTQGIALNFYKWKDDSFRFEINGISDPAFAITSQEMIKMFGVADPYIHVSIAGDWYAGANISTSLKVKGLYSETAVLESAPPVDFGNCNVTIDGTNIITNFQPGSTIQNFISRLRIRSDTQVVFKNQNMAVITDYNTKVSTGTNMEVINGGVVSQIFKTVVFGDLQGDGIINVSDLAFMKSVLLKINLLDGAMKTAGEICFEGKSSISDLLSIKKHIIGISTNAIDQNKIADGLSHQRVRMTGRFKKTGDAAYQFGWSGSMIEAGFIGTGIGINLKRASLSSYDVNNKDDFVQVIVDNSLPYKVKISDTTQQVLDLADGLPNSYHIIKVVKQTEGMVGTLEFGGFVYRNGQAAFVPAGSSRKIEVIGDSITAAYGNEAIGGFGFYPTQENAYKSYGMTLARNLSANCTIIAWSGMGMYQDLLGRTSGTLTNVYGRTIPLTETNDWNFEDSIPDVLVINLGTNDNTSQVNPADFKAKYIEFLHTVRIQYPETSIFCCMGPMTYGVSSYVAEVVNTMNLQGDSRVYNFIFSPINQSTEGIGADGHPSAITDARMASELGDKIKQVLGWQ